MADQLNDQQTLLQRVHPECREFVITVEELLERRRREHISTVAQDDWWPRSWHRTELEDTVYSSYKQMRQGRVTRPPRREMVMAIADYLSCTLVERNRLLLAAHTAPISPYLTGDKLAELLPIATSVARQLSIPAMVINRDWCVHDQNAQMLESFAISPEQLAAIPPERRNVLHLLFDPNLPLRPNLAPYPDSWERMARQSIYGFKLANQLCQYEQWYADLVAQLMTLPDFEHHWRTVKVDISFDNDPSAWLRSPAVTVDVALARPEPGTQHARLRPLVISIGYFQFDFPLVLAFLPAELGAAAGDVP
ncbi:MAG: hypothetical protein Fur005_40470 [Roseiflexaceae bacterium]